MLEPPGPEPLARKGRRLLVDSRAVTEGELGSWAHDGHLLTAIARAQDHARAIARTDEGVSRPRRAVHVIPRAQRPLLVFDEQEAFAYEDEEVLLLASLVVVEAGRLPGRHDAKREVRERLHALLEVGPPLEEDAVGLEDAAAAEHVVVHPGRVGGVHHEPARTDRRQTRSDGLEACLLNHWILLACRTVRVGCLWVRHRARLGGTPSAERTRARDQLGLHATDRV